MIKKLVCASILALMCHYLNPMDVITAPGLYTYGIDITYEPTAANETVISILSSNVTLDLNSHVITQLAGNLQPGLDAITVGTGLTNVIIKNAIIRTISGVGIRVKNGASKITILDSKIDGCNAGGILLDGTIPGVIGAEIKNTTVLTCTGAGGNPAYGIRVIKGVSVGIYNSTISSNDAATTSSGYGISIESSQSCGVFNTLIGKTGGAGVAAGVRIVASSNSILQDTVVQGTLAYTGTSYGYLLEQCTNFLGLNCRSAVNVNAGFPCYGIALQNGQKNVLENCLSGFNSSTQLTAGILLNNESKTTVIQCTSRGNQTTSSGTAYGILLSGTCDLCSIDTNKVLNNAGVTSSFGIQDQRSPSTTAIFGNFAFNNGTNFSVTYPFFVALPVTNASLTTFPGTTDVNTSNSYMNINLAP